MRGLVNRSPDDILERAEHERFSRIKEQARSAAEKLTCFALSFGRQEAEEVFPEDNIGAAIAEMRNLGLIRETRDAEYEMHETVRAGLENEIALNTRRSAHMALADHYKKQTDISAQVFHLERAGYSSEAKEVARISFLRGDHWQSLSGFVIKHKLVTVSEVIGLVASKSKIDNLYMFGYILAKLPEPVPVEQILGVLRAQRSWFFENYNWSSAVVEACLRFAPCCLVELIKLSLEAWDTPDKHDSAMGIISVAMNRKACVISDEILQLFDGLDNAKKQALLPLMLTNCQREPLSRAFLFVSSDNFVEKDKSPTSWRLSHLNIKNTEDAIEFLAAISDVPGPKILARRSPLFGALTSVIWDKREQLRVHCINLLEDPKTENEVQKTAIRVLVLLSEPRLIEFCEKIAADKENPNHGFAALAPSLVPELIDRISYEALLFDSDQTMEKRLCALNILSCAGADLNVLYKNLQEIEEDPKKYDLWDFMFLSIANTNPFASAIPLLEKELGTEDTTKADLHVTTLLSLSHLPGTDTTSMLQLGLSHPIRSVRAAAAMGLANRRTSAAFKNLRKQFCVETDLEISIIIATAIIASGASSVRDLDGAKHSSTALSLWRCVLAARTRDISYATELVAIATDSNVHWQLRRAAIYAAGFLPFEVALIHMLPILDEQLVAPLDNHIALHTQSTLSWLLLKEASALKSFFSKSRESFVELITDVLDDSKQDLIDPRGLSSSQEAASWLYDRLSKYGWPTDPQAADTVICELNTPLLHSALLRGLRRVGRFDLIEDALTRANHVWIATKCLIELTRAENNKLNNTTLLLELLAKSPVAEDERLGTIIDNISRQPSEVKTPSSNAISDVIVDKKPHVHIGYEEAVAAIASNLLDFYNSKPKFLVFDELTAEQFEHLIRLADPINDYDNVGTERYVRGLIFNEDGHSVAQRSVSYTYNSNSPSSAAELIRPALVAGNIFKINIPWHKELLSRPFADKYINKIFTALAATGSNDVFYRLIYQDPHPLLPHVCSYSVRQEIKDLLDGRMIPFLTMHSASGTEEIFEGLCGLAREIETPAIDPVLENLFRRWTNYFKVSKKTNHLNVSHFVWRAFRYLNEHPRFNLIKDWHGLLMPVMSAPIRWHQKQDVTRVLERDPRSYIKLEQLLFRAEDWQIYFEDEIDRLQNSTERLFQLTNNQ